MNTTTESIGTKAERKATKTVAEMEASGDAHGLLRHFGIGIRGLGRTLGISYPIVTNAITPGACRGVRHATVVTVRARVGGILKASGIENPDKIWDMHDRQLREAA